MFGAAIVPPLPNGGEVVVEENEFRAAGFAECIGRCMSVEAQACLDTVLAAVTALESQMRKYKRGPKMAKRFERALEGLLSELLLAVHSASKSPWVYRPLARKAFKGTAITHADFTAATTALRTLALIERSKGYSRYGLGFDGKVHTLLGSCARWRATEAMLQIATANGITADNVAEHFRFGLPKDPLVVREASTRDGYDSGTKGSIMSIVWTPKASALHADVQRLNEFLATVEIRGGIHRGYVRGFNNGDAPDFDWNKGGRLYSRGGGYQAMKESERLKMTLDGSSVAEVDASASYLTILHGLTRTPFDAQADQYAVDSIPRPVVKTWLTASLGNKRLIARWPNDAVAEMKAEHNIDLRAYRPSVVGKLMVAKHPLLGRWSDLDVTWADLMYVESRAIVETMLMLLDGGRVPTLAMHDGLLVPVRYVDLAASMLAANYLEHCGVAPRITIEGR